MRQFYNGLRLLLPIYFRIFAFQQQPVQNPLTFIKKLFTKVYHSALRSIAFYPVFISLGLFLVALMTLSLENAAWVLHIKSSNPYLFIEDTATARTILSTLIASILSLTVFSFTMVMVVLSQASSNFSPRLLPGLVSDKKNQLILGCFVGTLLYVTIVLISLGAYKLENSTVGMSTTIAAILALGCVGLFVSFIHNISSAIQIQNIVNKIYRKADKKLDANLNKKSSNKSTSEQFSDYNFITINSKKSGYYHEFDLELIDSGRTKKELQIIVIPHQGQHIYEGQPLFKVNRPLSNDEEEALRFACSISGELHEGEYPFLGLIKLMEIAVRAMSPGLNDPKTAMDVVHKLALLLSKMICLSAFTLERNDKLNITIRKTNNSTAELLKTIFQPIRFYSRSDSTVTLGLVQTLQFVNSSSKISITDKNAIKEEQDALKMSIETNIINKIDKQHILKIWMQDD